MLVRARTPLLISLTRFARIFPMKTIFTTGQIAKICKVSSRTVSKWFDSGRLRGYRIPGGQDRRIPREHLIRFLKEHGMPFGGGLEDSSVIRILYVGPRDNPSSALELIAPLGEEFEVECVTGAFEAGARMLSESLPACILLDHAMKDVGSLVQSFGKNQYRERFSLIGIGPHGTEFEDGMDGFVSTPAVHGFLSAEVVRLVRKQHSRFAGGVS